MAETKLATRILNKYDSYTTWFNANPILKKGEISICEVPVETDQDNAVTQSSKPAILFKVGDGKTAWKSLPWATGLAGDVHGWAKAANKPTYSATEITGLEDFIAGEIQDTDTQYNLEFDSTTGTLKFQSKAKDATAWTDVDSFTFAEGATDGKFKITDGKGQSTEVKIHGLGTAAYQNTDAFVAPDDLAAYMPLAGGKFTGDVSFAEGKKLTLAQAPTDVLEAASKGYVDTTVKNATAGLTGAMHFKGTVTAIPPTGTETYVSGDVVLFGNKEYVYDNSDATKPEKDKWIELGDEGSYALNTIEINGHNLKSNFDLTAAEVGADPAGTATTEIGKLSANEVGGTGKYIQAISQTNGKITATEASMPVALKNPNALTFTGAVTGTYDGSAAKTIHIPTQTEALSGVGNDDVAVEHQFVTAVKQTNGVVAVTRSAIAADDVSGLAAIAKTGNVKDLLQTEGDTLILDCGSATVNI